jgi:transitional endoplasmic reticulum ATPase
MSSKKSSKKGKTLDTVGEEMHVADIVHHGHKLILPEGMALDACIKMLLQRREYLEQNVNIQQDYDRFPWDGAWALHEVLRERYGWAQMKPTKTMFGEQPPKMINVEIAPGDIRSVPWGQFSLPNIEDGRINCGFNGTQFVLHAQVKRKFESYVRELFQLVKDQLDKHSIYMGQPVKLSYNEDHTLPEISFVDVNDADTERLIYSRDIEGAIHTNLFTPIDRIDDCVANGISIKRGVLLAGPYGCGKTLAAKAAAKLARNNDVTFIYIDRASDYAKAIEFAKVYSNPAAVVFCEDIDRVTSGHRTQQIDDILNIIDGVDSKSFNIMTVLTTNNLDKITPAMQRPGRLDAVIEVTAPDAEAAERLVRAYGGDLVSEKEDLAKVGKELAGYVPAVIAEVVKRAKLSQIRLLEPGEPMTQITSEALLDAAITIRPQAERLLKAKEEDAPHTIDQLITGHVDRTIQGSRLYKDVREIHERVTQ